MHIGEGLKKSRAPVLLGEVMQMEISDIFNAIDENKSIDGVTIMSSGAAGQRYYAALRSLGDTLSTNVSQWEHGHVLHAGPEAFRRWIFITEQKNFDFPVRALMFVQSKRSDHWSLIEVARQDLYWVGMSIKEAFIARAAQERIDMSDMHVAFKETHTLHSSHSTSTYTSTSTWYGEFGNLVHVSIGMQSSVTVSDMMIADDIISRVMMKISTPYSTVLEVPQGTEYDMGPDHWHNSNVPVNIIERVPVPRNWWPVLGCGKVLLEYFDE